MHRRNVRLGLTPRNALQPAPRTVSALLLIHFTFLLQVNLDFQDEADMVQMARLGIALQPIATALFANSPFRDGKPTGYLSWRSHVWTDTVRRSSVCTNVDYACTTPGRQHSGAELAHPCRGRACRAVCLVAPLLAVAQYLYLLPVRLTAAHHTCVLVTTPAVLHAVGSPAGTFVPPHVALRQFYEPSVSCPVHSSTQQQIRLSFVCRTLTVRHSAIR